MWKGFCSATAGFLAAAAFASTTMSVLMMIGTGRFDLEFALKAPMGFFHFALVIVLVFGIPTFLLLRPFRPGHWMMPLAAGAMLGLVLLSLLQLALPGQFAFLLVLLVVSLSALVFLLVWRWAEEGQGACCACCAC
jgi:hypothetical protein